MKGVISACVSAGSNQVGASETCTAQVNCPCGAAARARRGAPARRPRALAAIRSRRVSPDMYPAELDASVHALRFRIVIITSPSLWIVIAGPDSYSREDRSLTPL